MRYIFVFISLLLFSCSCATEVVHDDSDKKALEILAKEIKDIADTSVCSQEFTCAFIGFGAKPCGGNWEYLIYTNSIDVDDFLAKVKSYNDLEKAYNTKNEITSDCSFLMPPNEVVCEDAKCKVAE